MDRQPNCPFCHPQQDPKQHIILENTHCYFLQKETEQEVLEGSGVIVPKTHRESVFDLSADEWNSSYRILQAAKTLLDARYSPDGYTIGWNVGKAAGQHILHAHLHVIPRFNDEPHVGKGLRYWLKQPENKRFEQRSKNFKNQAD